MHTNDLLLQKENKSTATSFLGIKKKKEEEEREHTQGPDLGL